MVAHTINASNFNTGANGTVLTGNGIGSAPSFQPAAGGAVLYNSFQSYRLTLVSNTPVSSDVSSQTTLYLTPYKGYDLSLYTGAAWQNFQAGQLSITNAGLSASTVYDVFVQYNGGTPQLSLTAWASATARNTALAYQNGKLVLSGTPTSLYVGTVYVDGSSNFDDNSKLRYVWNYYNRVNRNLYVSDSATSWTYTSNNWHQANANAANQINVVVGLVEDVINLTASHMFSNPNLSVNGSTGIGINSTSTDSSTFNGTLFDPAAGEGTRVSAELRTLSLLGWNQYVWLEASPGGGTTTWYNQTPSTGIVFGPSGLGGNLLM